MGLSPHGIQVIISIIYDISCKPKSKHIPKQIAGRTIILSARKIYDGISVKSFPNAKVDITIPVIIILKGPTQLDALAMIETTGAGRVIFTRPTIAPKNIDIVIGLISFLIFPPLLVKIA